MEEYIGILKTYLEAERNEEFAKQMGAYLKNKFQLYGIKKPKLVEILKDFTAVYGYPTVEEIPEFMKMIWAEPYRELHQIGLVVFDKYTKKYPEETIDLLEYLITHQSWWDTVDALAVRGVGNLMKRFPHLIPEMNEKFINSDNFWLNRTAILFQLKYKSKTDTDLLVTNILKHSHQKEFFIRKAIGWVLREYSKTDGNFVRNFVANHELSSLSKREALKWLDKQAN